MVELEEIFSSVGRAKVLVCLAKHEALTVHAISKMTGLSHGSVLSHLKFLETCGILRSPYFGENRLVEFNKDSPRAVFLKQFISDWEKISR